jgi:miniconductance mechanosensitive channel
MTVDSLRDLLTNPAVRATLGLLGLVAISTLLHLAMRRYVLRLVQWGVRRTKAEWDGIFLQNRVPHRLALMVPLLAFQVGLSWVPGLSVQVEGFIQRLLVSCMILVVGMTVAAVLSAGHALYLRLPIAAGRPIKSYVQLLQIVVYGIAGIFIVARLADQSPWFFVSGLGAMMAIILLIFRDTILSLVASIQLTSNDLIRVGDWIEMPQFGADGDVKDIALNTVSVLNWDKTITVIPTHKFLEHSFKNWRNMYGIGRQIKRSISINASTIRFLTEEEIRKFRRFVLLTDYIDRKVEELREFNARYGEDPELIINQRRLTNIGTFRAYVDAYLRNHPMINTNLTFLVRQLQPTAEGLPIQIYVYTTDTRWAVYEGVQADVFDHLTAILPEFGLSMYQRPAGDDLRVLVEGPSPRRVDPPMLEAEAR